ncbi:Protein of unknown function [Lactobacillus helveticus CIRM-BIA 104]|uniref:Uncharacterized protein n=1 Tax=Lactobacillus helveticus CIRM-BIA 104 TaxID=1226333 RepID=U6FFL0_LACHE|nr:Protein of unknown function [Lactobacillus helveticus CIRM-BIA 104]
MFPETRHFSAGVVHLAIGLGCMVSFVYSIFLSICFNSSVWS